MSPRKKKSVAVEDEADRAIAAQMDDALGGDAAKNAAESAAFAYAHAKVEENPRGAPETISVPFVQVLPVEPVAATITTTASVEPVIWENVTTTPTVQRLVEPVVVAAPPCALEGAPIGAKCVVSRTEEGKAVRLLDSTGVVTLDKADIFYTLPAGAKVRKVAPDAFEVYRLGVQEAPLFVAHSAREAVRRFLEVVV